MNIVSIGSFAVCGTFVLTACQLDAATLSSCDEAGLRAAVSGGGNITFACDGTITLTSPVLITNAVALDAAGRQVTISGGNATRLFHVTASGTLQMSNLTLTGGFQTSGGIGAGIFNEGGSLNLANCRLTNHRVVGGVAASGQGGGKARGAALASLGGNVTLTNCAFVDNRSVGGAGVGAPLRLPGGEAGGGGIFVENGQLDISYCRFTGNSALGGASTLPEDRAGDSLGGAIYASDSTVRIRSAFFETNSVEGGAGTQGDVRGGALFLNQGSCEIRESRFVRNRAEGGSAVTQVPIIRDGSGGAIDGNGELLIIGSFLEGNRAIGTRSTGYGGAIRNLGTLRLVASTVVENEAGPGHGIGGGIFSLGTLMVTNSTFVGNRALGRDGTFTPRGIFPSTAGRGGGICISNGQCVLVHSTFASNDARGGKLVLPSGTTFSPSDGGAVAIYAGSLSAAGSIFAYSKFGSNVFGTITDLGHNLSSDGSAQFSTAGSLNNVDPVLSPLLDFGGPTPTMALLNGSPAIDAGPVTGFPSIDQRGIARPFGAASDIGAFESAPPYSVFGRITGYVSPPSGMTVQSGSQSTSPDASGRYALRGLASGVHTITPSSPEAVFVLSNRVLNLGPDVIQADFHAYRSNALTTITAPVGTMSAVFAGEIGQTYWVWSTTDFSAWQPWSTNVVESSGLFSITDTNAATGHRFFEVVRP